MPTTTKRRKLLQKLGAKKQKSKKSRTTEGEHEEEIGISEDDLQRVEHTQGTQLSLVDSPPKSGAKKSSSKGLKRECAVSPKKRKGRRGIVPDEEVSEKRLKRREARRMRRAKMKVKLHQRSFYHCTIMPIYGQVCFNCRGYGHKLQDCPNTDNKGICFKCGSTEHTSRLCKARVAEGVATLQLCF